MATRNEARVSSATAKARRHSKRSEQLRKTEATSAANAQAILCARLGALSDAISLVTVVHRAIAAREDDGVGDEELALRHALGLLRAAYDGIDLAFMRSQRSSPSSTR